ncbi:MAG: hypothetical protein ACRCZC_03675 [Culicoidibacterales bacterium]
MKLKTLILVVSGVNGEAQTQPVLSSLHSVVGVTDAKFSVNYQTISVSYDADTLRSGQQIIDAITSTGVEVL